MRFSREYRTYLRSTAWAEKRERYWRLRGRRCQACGSRSQLQVDHLTYVRLGRERLTDLVGLCQPCHVRVTRARRESGARPGRGYRKVTEVLFGITLPAPARRTTRASPRTRAPQGPTAPDKGVRRRGASRRRTSPPRAA